MSKPSSTRAEHINKRLKRMKKWRRDSTTSQEESGSAKEQQPQETPQASAPDFTPSYSRESTPETQNEDPISARAVPEVHEEYVSFEEMIHKLMLSVSNNDVEFSSLKEKITFLLDTKQRLMEQRKSSLDLDLKEFQLSELKKNSKKRAMDQAFY